jgi:hypothetical protein
MKVRNLAATLALAIALPIAFQSSSLAQENLVPGTDTQANIDAAKDRLDKAKVRLEISSKQVEAAKARLKAADAEFKAAKANHDARTLEHQAKKLSDASGLPEITEGQIERGRTKAIAEKVVVPAQEETTAPAPVDLSKTRLDFNAQPEGEQPAPAAAPTETAPEAPNPDKQAIVDPAYNVAPPQVAATSAPTVTEQPPIVP